MRVSHIPPAAVERQRRPNLKTRDGEKTPEEFSRVTMRKRAIESAKEFAAL